MTVHKHNIISVINIKETLWVVMTVVMKCHSENNDTSIAKFTLLKTFNASFSVTLH